MEGRNAPPPPQPPPPPAVPAPPEPGRPRAPQQDPDPANLNLLTNELKWLKKRKLKSVDGDGFCELVVVVVEVHDL